VPLIPLIDVLEIVAIAALAVGTVTLAVRSLPSGLIARVRRAETIVAEFKTDLAAIVDERTAWRVQGERLAEEVGTMLDQVERKRSSTAAAASRMKLAGEHAAAPRIEDMSRAQQIQHARRSMGG
jgi:hypothetical protein